MRTPLFKVKEGRPPILFMRLGFRPKIFAELLEKAKRKQSDSFSREAAEGTPPGKGTLDGEKILRYIHPRWVGTKGRNRGEILLAQRKSWSRNRNMGRGRDLVLKERKEKERRKIFFLRGRIVSREFTVPTAILHLHFFAYVRPVTDQPVQKLIFKDSPYPYALSRSS